MGRTEIPRVPRVVLFDMDDTLFDHSFSLRRGLAAVWKSDPKLRSRPLAEFVVEYERLLEEIHPRVLRGQTTHAEARVERFRRLFEWAGSQRPEGEITRLSARYRTAYQSSRRAVEGAPALLRALHGRVTVGVVSNNHTVEQREKVRAIGIGGYLDFLLTSEDTGSEKPHPEIFRAALARVSASPEEAVMVGDNWPADIVGARALGIRSVWLNRRGVARPDRAPEVLELRSLRPTVAVRRSLLGEGPSRRRPNPP
ncbi:MAG: HAD family hydrolase [Thermoplasmata archaeon]|nr:HAD family hydrolase [Thermoplasmata archaeon]